MMRLKTLGAAGGLLAFLALAPAAVSLCARASEGLEARIEAVAARPELAGSRLAILARDLRDGETITSRNAQTLLPPASTAKLVSGAGSLVLLGPDHRFVTPLVRTGPVERGVLLGDLVLVATGDPNLSQRLDESGEHLRFTDADHTYAGFFKASTVPGDPLEILQRFADTAVGAGVREVRGDVVVDDGLFSETEDEFVGPVSAACVNDNVIDFMIRPGSEPGQPVSVSLSPRLDCVAVKVSALTAEPDSPPDLWVEAVEPGIGFEVHGQLAAGSPPVLRVGRLAEPAAAIAAFLGELLERRGVKITGRARRARFGPSVYTRYPAIARHRSAPFSEALRVTLKVSHNLHATMLPITVGALKAKRGDRRAGFSLMREEFRRAGLAVDSVHLQSGSGGSRADRLSASFVVDLLGWMARRPEFPAFYRALPIAGIDGTLAGHLRSPPLRGRVHAKTGTLVYHGSFNDRWIYLSKALAGYLDLRTPEFPRRMLAFSITIADTLCDDRKEGARVLFRAQEEILEAIVEEVAGR